MNPRVTLWPVTLLVLSLIVAGALGAAGPTGAAQLEWPWCNASVPAPDDDLASQAIGLTESELEEQYGPGVAVQDGIHYQRDGYVLIATNCDIVIEIEPDSELRQIDAAHALAQSLLPEDAILVGFWALGNPLGMGDVSPREAEEWISGSLAGRYRLLGEARGGSVLVYYYLAAKDDPNQPIQFDMVERIELRTAQVPRVLATPAP